MFGLPTCRDVSRLLSRAQETRISWRQRLGVRLHLLICSSCRAYAANLAWLKRILGLARSKAAAARLGDDAKARIRAALDDVTKEK